MLLPQQLYLTVPFIGKHLNNFIVLIVSLFVKGRWKSDWSFTFLNSVEVWQVHIDEDRDFVRKFVRKLVNLDSFVKEGAVCEGEDEGGDRENGEKEKEGEKKNINASLLENMLVFFSDEFYAFVVLTLNLAYFIFSIDQFGLNLEACRFYAF